MRRCAGLRKKLSVGNQSGCADTAMPRGGRSCGQLSAPFLAGRSGSLLRPRDLSTGSLVPFWAQNIFSVSALHGSSRMCLKTHGLEAPGMRGWMAHKKARSFRSGPFSILRKIRGDRLVTRLRLGLRLDVQRSRIAVGRKLWHHSGVNVVGQRVGPAAGVVGVGRNRGVADQHA